MEVKLSDTKVIVSSDEGMMEHNIASWMVDHGKLGLSELKEPKENVINDTLRAWIEGMPFDDRVLFIDEIFGALQASGAVTLEDLSASGLTGFEAIWSKVKDLSTTSKSTLSDLQAAAMEAAVRRITGVPGSVLEGTKTILAGVSSSVAEGTKNIVSGVQSTVVEGAMNILAGVAAGVSGVAEAAGALLKGKDDEEDN